MADKRGLQRAALTSTARVSSAGVEIECRIVNLSTSGMAFETDASHDLGTTVHVTTDLGLGTPKIELDAAVVRREPRGERILWGIAFENLPRHVISKIETYVRRKGLEEVLRS